MKKLLLIIILSIVSLTGRAQLNITTQVEKPVTIAKARGGLVHFYSRHDRYYLVLPTSNQFDDPFIIVMGDGKESALATLRDMLELSKTIQRGESVVIDNAGKRCSLHKGALNNGLELFMDYYAGNATFLRTEMEKCIKKLEKMTE